MGVFGIEFVPWDEPLEMRLQTLAVAAWITTALFASFTGSVVALLLIVHTTVVRWFVVVYLVWIYFFDWDTCEQGGRNNWATRWMRNSVWWRYYCAYFPIKLVKTAELDPSRNYLLCAFPHGLIGIGLFGAFINTSELGFDKLYPGLRSTIITLGQNFRFPFAREIAYSLGFCSASANSINHIISTPGGGRAAVLTVGGAEEALNSRPGVYRVVLRKRNGFVRLALKSGTPLVPVFSFGEPDLYDQMDNPEGSWLRSIQKLCKKYIGFVPIVPIGRGLFQYSYGYVPRRRPITIVVGSPLQVPKITNPTTEDVIEYRGKFEAALKDLFVTHKHKYLPSFENTELIIE